MDLNADRRANKTSHSTHTGYQQRSVPTDMAPVFPTLLHHSSTVRVLGHLQQDLLHVPVLPREVHQPCDLLLKGAGQGHQLDKLALWAFVHLQAEHRPSVSSHQFGNNVGQSLLKSGFHTSKRCALNQAVLYSIPAKIRKNIFPLVHMIPLNKLHICHASVTHL